MAKISKEALDAYRQRRAKEGDEIEAAKVELATTHGLERNAKFDRAWSIAWQHGHSSGIDDVKCFFHDLADLLKP